MGLKVELLPIVQQVEADVVEILTPPFRIYEPFALVGHLGDAIHEAAPLQTEADYAEALTSALQYFDEKYNLVTKWDAALKWKGVLAPIELIDGQAISYILYHVAIPQMAAQLAARVG